MFASQRVRLATIPLVWAVALTALAASGRYDGEASILTFASGYGSQDTSIDLTVRPDGNTVRIRSC